MADLSGEVRVGLGMVKELLQSLEQREDMTASQIDATRFMVEVGAADILMPLRTAGHEIGEEGVVFLQDHEDHNKAVQGKSRGDSK